MSKTRRRRWSSAWSLFWTKVLTTFFRRVIFAVRSLEDPIPNLRSRLAVSITTLSTADLAAYLRFRPEQGLKKIRERLGRGHRCYASWYQGQIIDVTWVAVGRAYFQYLRRDMLLKPQDVYVYDSFTSPAFRGQGLYQAKVAYVMRRCKEQGYSRNVAVYAVENRAVRKMLTRMGVRYVGTYHALKLGSWLTIWRSRDSDASLPRLVKPGSTEPDGCVRVFVDNKNSRQ